MESQKRGAHGCGTSDARHRTAFLLRRAAIGMALAASLAGIGGCSSISTPLPDLGPVATGSLSKQQEKAAVDDLSRQGSTHAQDAEKQIEQSR